MLSAATATKEAGFRDSFATLDLGECLGTLERLGFRQVLRLPFKTQLGQEQTLLAYLQPEETLLFVFETYGNGLVRDTFLYYNLRRSCSEGAFHVRCMKPGGTWVKSDREVFVGRHRVRGRYLEELIARLRASGKFISPWVETPNITLLHDGDPLSATRRADLTAERMRLLPPEVRQALLLA